MCIQWDWFFFPTTYKTFPPSCLPSRNLPRTSNLIFPQMNLASHFPSLSCVPCPLFQATVPYFPGSKPLTPLCIPLASKAQKVDLFLLLASASSPTLLCLSSGAQYLYLGCCNHLLIHPLKFTLFPLIHHTYCYYQIHLLVFDLLTHLTLLKTLHSFNLLTAVISYVVSWMKSCPETPVCQLDKSRLLWSHQESILDHCPFCLHNTQNSAEEILNKCQLPESRSDGPLKFPPNLLFLSYFPLEPGMSPTVESRGTVTSIHSLCFPALCLLLIWMEFSSV